MKKTVSLLTAMLILFGCGKENDSGQPYTESPLPPDTFTHADVQDVVMYEVNLRAFSSQGDLKGVEARLDYLQALGVNVIWLMPIYPQGEVKSINSPYSIKNYTAVSSEYGNLQDLKDFVAAAHQRDMAVILDWVANHTAWDHPWITEHKEWYTQNTAGEIVHPPGTNWHDVADLNFENSEMRLAMIASMQYWVEEARIDGFRCDYADGLPFDFWQQAINSLRLQNQKELLFLAEGSRADHFQAGFDLNFGWNFYGQLKNVFDGQPANTLLNVHSQEYAQVPINKRKLRFTTNHDESAWDATPIALFNGKKGATAATVAMSFMGSTPLIYCGQETGRAANLLFFSNDPIDWTVNQDMQKEYKRIYRLYRDGDALIRALPNKFYADNDVVCFAKESADKKNQLLVLVNVRNQNVNFSVPAELQNKNWQNLMDSTSLQLSNNFTLSAYQYLIAKSLE